jgi:hypothetical protein
MLVDYSNLPAEQVSSQFSIDWLGTVKIQVKRRDDVHHLRLGTETVYRAFYEA